MVPKDIDKELGAIKELRWLPWVGDNYKKNNLLLIGHSHYSDENTNEDFTRNVIETFLSDPAAKKGDWKYFFLQTTKIMGYDPTDDVEENKRAIKNLWDDFAFMQFFQGNAGEKYVESITACQAVYRILEAEKAIVFYKNGWAMLNNEHANEKRIDQKNRLYIPHPSWISRYGGIDKARQDIKDFLTT